MPRHTQPREVAELKGQTRVHPERYAKHVPKAAFALGQPPEYMSGEAKAVWFELETYALQGVLTCAERPLFEVVSNLLADFRRGPDEFPTARIGHLISALGRLGMSPADRQKLGTSKSADENPFDSF